MAPRARLFRAELPCPPPCAAFLRGLALSVGLGLCALSGSSLLVVPGGVPWPLICAFLLRGAAAGLGAGLRPAFRALFGFIVYSDSSAAGCFLRRGGDGGDGGGGCCA